MQRGYAKTVLYEVARPVLIEKWIPDLAMLVRDDSGEWVAVGASSYGEALGLERNSVMPVELAHQGVQLELFRRVCAFLFRVMYPKTLSRRG